jgi:hypothetical protein
MIKLSIFEFINKKFMKKLFLIFIFFILILKTYAQEDDNLNINKVHEFGIHAGATSGIGLSYRYWPGRFGIQFTALPFKSGDEAYINIGLTGLYSFYQSSHVRFFGYLANSYNYDRYTSDDFGNDVNNWNSEKKTHTKKGYNIGFGPGFGFGSRVRINLMAGYGFYDIFHKFNILPTGEIGLYFRF